MKTNLAWFEINVNDLERAKNFYEMIFGSTFTFIDMPDAPMYSFNINQNNGDIGGALVKSNDSQPSKNGTLLYFSTDDINKIASKIEPSGGKVILPKTSIGDFGFIALFLDTEGNKIGLHATI